MLQIGLEITTLAVLDFVQSLRHINIERRQESWFGFDSKLLQIFGVEIEVLLAQRTHTHQLHLTFQDVEKHGQLVEPGFSQKPPPLRYTVVVAELASHIKIIVFVYVSLQILGIGIHRTELKYVKLLPILAHTTQFHQWTIGVRLVVRLTFLLPDDTIAVVDVLLADDFETAIIQPTQDLGTWKDLPHLPSAEVVETACQCQFWAHPMP